MQKEERREKQVFDAAALVIHSCERKQVLTPEVAAAAEVTHCLACLRHKQHKEARGEKALCVDLFHNTLCYTQDIVLHFLSAHFTVESVQQRVWSVQPRQACLPIARQQLS